MLLHFILLVSCCLLLLLETVILEHAKWLKMFEKTEVLAKQELDSNDIQQGWGFNQDTTIPVESPILTKEADTVVYQQSILTEEHENFFNALASMTKEVDERSKESVSSQYQATSLENSEAPPEEERENQESEFTSWDQLVAEETKAELSNAVEPTSKSDYLTMGDWEEAPMPTTIDTRLSTIASHKIGDNFIGEQLWIVEVVGYEQSYIHVSDGASRAWLNLRKFENASKGDVLSLLVERDMYEQLHVLDADLLQRKSNDFALEIDDNYEEEVSNLEFAI